MTDEGEDGTEPDDGICDVPGCGKPAGHPARHRNQTSNVRNLREATGRKPRVILNPEAPTSRQAVIAEVERITDEFQNNLMAQLAPWAPVVGGMWVTKAEANTRAVMTIAAGHPKVALGILKAAEAEAWFALGTFAVCLVVAVGVEFHMVEGDGRLSTGLGIDEIWEQVEAEKQRVGGRVAAHYAPAPDTGPTLGGLAAEI